MEGKMKCTLIPTLKTIALVQIAVGLCNENVDSAVIGSFYDRGSKVWRTLRKIVREKTSNVLKGSLQKEILNAIRTICQEMTNWRLYHQFVLLEREYIMENIHRLCWTFQGTVNKKKTAEIFIKDESLDITIRYKLACANCLENDIPLLWDKIPEDRRKAVYNEIDPRKVFQKDLVAFWSYAMEGEVGKLNCSIEHKSGNGNHYALECAVRGGNLAASEYFLQKLTPQEREESLIGLAGKLAEGRSKFFSGIAAPPEEDFTDVLCFLLAQMTEAQQVEVFEKHPYEVLGCFLDWPWQGLFIEISVRVFAFLPEKGYERLLKEMTNKVLWGHSDCNYQKLFSEFWRRSPIALKQHVIRQLPNSLLMTRLFDIKHRENISLILKDVALEDKEKLLLGYEGRDICKRLSDEMEWGMLTCFINEVSECISSQDDIKKFSEEFAEYIKFWKMGQYGLKKDKEKAEFYDVLKTFLRRGEIIWNSPPKIIVIRRRKGDLNDSN